MAIKYFDLNGSTAGFGTLTGAWNTTGAAFWSDSSAGTAVPANYTFTSADTAAFGFAGTTATAGTATIAAGLTVTLNSITTANLAGLQTIAAGAGGTLNLVLDGATVPTINVGSVGGLTISSAITGTAGFTKAGTGVLSITGTAKAIGGAGSTVSVTGGTLNLGIGASGTADQLSNIENFSISSGAALGYNGVTAYTENALTLSGAGLVAVYSSGGITFQSNTSALTGSVLVADDGTSASGLITYDSGVAFPSNAVLAWYFRKTTAATTVTHKYTGSANITTAKNYTISANSGTVGGTAVFDHSATGGATFDCSGTVLATNNNFTSATFNVNVAGTAGAATFSNTVGNDTGITRVIGFSKTGTGKAVLSGANTYTGTTTISAGTLALNNAAAAGVANGTTSVITQTGGTLEFGAVVNKGTNGVTLNSVGGVDAVYAASGTTGLTCAGVALNAAATIFNIAGGTFTLTNSAAMSGTGFGIQKNGAGELALVSAVSNNFTGPVAVAAGTLAINAAATLGAGVSGVALTGTLKYAGTGSATISRSLTLTGSAPMLEAAGTTSAAAVTFSAFTHAAGARTLTLKGANTGNNTFSAALTDNGASVVGLTKQGAGKWILSAQPTYSGTTTVSEGELQFNGLNLNFDLTMNGTGVLSNTVLAGTSKTITCNGGTPEIVATTTGNTVTGTTAVTSGILRLTTEQLSSSKPVKVLGDTAVTVTGALRTTVGTLQKGQMRYGGNLTFNNGSALYIG